VNFITKINVTWDGKGYHDNGNNGATLYIWNGSGYEQLDTTDSGDENTEITLTGGVTSSIGSYINGGQCDGSGRTKHKASRLFLVY